jgi:hypothetical protein
VLDKNKGHLVIIEAKVKAVILLLLFSKVISFI